MIIALLGTALVPLAAATGQDDAGSNGDAPNYHRDAINIPLENFTGTLEPAARDYRDWYRVNVTPETGLRVTMAPPTGADFDLLLYDDNGRRLDASFGSGDQVETAIGVTATGAIRIGVLYWSGSGNYQVTLEAVSLTDVAVTKLDVTPRPVETDWGTAPTGTQRDIEVTVENLGPGDADTVEVFVWTETADGAWRPVMSELLGLDAGEARTLTVRWDGTGQIGDVDVHAWVRAPLDANAENNHKIAESYVLVGNTGTGADAMNTGVFAGAWPAGYVYAGTFYEKPWKGAIVYAGGPLYLAGGSAWVAHHDQDGPYAGGCAYALVLWRCAWV